MKLELAKQAARPKLTRIQVLSNSKNYGKQKKSPKRGSEKLVYN